MIESDLDLILEVVLMDTKGSPFKVIGINKKWATTKTRSSSRLYTNKNYKNAWEFVRLVFKCKALEQNVKVNHKERYVLTYSFGSGLMRNDYDAFIKQIGDELQGICYTDDSKICFGGFLKTKGNEPLTVRVHRVPAGYRIKNVSIKYELEKG